MKTRTVSRYFLDTDHGVFETLFRVDRGLEIIVEVVGNKAVVGHLLVDEDASSCDPTDNDMGGKIYSSSRHRRGDHAKMQEALGLDANWRPDMDDWYDEAFETVIRQKIEDIQKRLSPTTRSIEIDWRTRAAVCTYRGRPHTHQFSVSLMTNELLYRSERVDRFLDQVTDLQRELWEKARKNGVIGHKYAVPLDVYEHGGTIYSVSGEGIQCRWDTARSGAVWTPDGDEDLIADIEMSEYPDDRAIELARDTCAEYSAWVNGEVYGVVKETYTREGPDAPWVSDEDHDSCWGYIGYSYAKGELKSEVANIVKTWRGDEAA
jgi:hypothetical protein